ncbi:hypothetical protein MOJ79_06425 [Calidifontimicrobium sp. SYSU G02091]|uniref:hypothetical protein n=1 Tax=Calidifontimicrobium sp. SYSU G02091 TaxID=2926421 RepID=UPI001F5376EA|nr:hypothetical protein [Calidifontimicrobium sp. SYSU G02091]MCI1191474.1 hypothetical protein [Calidifontimicrobium sp. SYSU G02091]
MTLEIAVVLLSTALGVAAWVMCVARLNVMSPSSAPRQMRRQYIALHAAAAALAMQALLPVWLTLLVVSAGIVAFLWMGRSRWSGGVPPTQPGELDTMALLDEGHGR